jgi:outer membrane scaffolding protein for murein synthesis (MipA/OmpV family)
LPQVGRLLGPEWRFATNWRSTFLFRDRRLTGDAAVSPFVDGDSGEGNADQVMFGAYVACAW